MTVAKRTERPSHRPAQRHHHRLGLLDLPLVSLWNYGKDAELLALDVFVWRVGITKIGLAVGRINGAQMSGACVGLIMCHVRASVVGWDQCLPAHFLCFV